MNRHAYRLTQRLGFSYCSDTRGSVPFVPVYQGEIIACPQLPTTLPTLDEMIGSDGSTTDNVADHLLELTSARSPAGHVYTLHAELEGMKSRAGVRATARRLARRRDTSWCSPESRMIAAQSLGLAQGTCRATKPPSAQRTQGRGGGARRVQGRRISDARAAA